MEKAKNANAKKQSTSQPPAIRPMSLATAYLNSIQAPETSEESEIEVASHFGDESDDSYWFTSSDGDYDEEDPDEAAYKANRMVMMAGFTHYDVIKEVAKFNFEYHLTKKEYCNWDIYWCDGPIGLKLISRMKAHQRVNHMPGIYNLAKKNMLGRNLMKL